jgi:radical SAM enzyme (TIGR01210 family)
MSSVAGVFSVADSFVRPVAFNDEWVLARRSAKATLDAGRPYATAWEEEPDAAGALVPTAVVLLTNRECPFRCVMCDLWVNTLDDPVPRGAIPAQIRGALAGLPPARQVKLYNAGSFFDPQAIPAEDDEAIAGTVDGLERVIVESHPAFLAGVHGERCLRFRDRIGGRLEVAIGLETAHPDVLARLNKRMSLASFRRAAAVLSRHDIDLRVFVLLNPPYLQGRDAVEWACRSIDVAAECGAVVSSIIPTRSGNGAVEALGNHYQKPRLGALEHVVEYGLSLGRGRVFADLWDIERFFDCECSPRRATRLRAMNRLQHIPAPVECACDTSG